jgi:hypothetical protein
MVVSSVLVREKNSRASACFFLVYNAVQRYCQLFSAETAGGNKRSALVGNRGDGAMGSAQVGGIEAGMFWLEAGEKKTEDLKSGPYGFFWSGPDDAFVFLFLTEAV